MITAVSHWAKAEADVTALTLVGSYTADARPGVGVPLRERRVRTHSGLQVELGIVSPTWAALPLDPGTATVLRDGCRILHDPQGVLQKAMAALLTAAATAPVGGRGGWWRDPRLAIRPDLPPCAGE